jgi:hypothetical protein
MRRRPQTRLVRSIHPKINENPGRAAGVSRACAIDWSIAISTATFAWKRTMIHDHDGRPPNSICLLIPVFRDSTSLRGGSRSKRVALFATGQSAVAQTLFGSHGHDAMAPFNKAVTLHTVGSDRLTRRMCEDTACAVILRSLLRGRSAFRRPRPTSSEL